MAEAKVEHVSTDLLSVCATNSSEGEGGADLDVLVTVTPPAGEKRAPTDIVCVVDISGSMSTEAKVKKGAGDSESHGLSMLDVVKHAVKTVASICDKHDRVGVVSYSDKARVEIGLTKCNKSGTKKVIEKTDALHTEGLTNLWDGLLQGMNLLKDNKQAGRAQAVLLLTDGLPNVNPPRGELEMLKRYREEHGTDVIVSTFGFGYQLNSELLDQLAVEGNGSYCFIPDASFVGTVFIHAASNILTTWSRGATLSLEPMNGAKIGLVLGGIPSTDASWGKQIRVGSIQYGQPRDVVVRLSLPEGGGEGEQSSYVNATIKLTTISGEDLSAESEGNDREGGGNRVVVQRNRCVVVDTLVKALKDSKSGNLDKAQKLIADTVDEMTKDRVDDPLAEGILKDLSGQGAESVSKQEFFTKWGRHYLPSLIRAHQIQQCNNFKDPGVQFYGGKLFESVRDVADTLFLTLPPPKPSVPKASYGGYRGGGGGGGGARSAPRAAVNMRSYHYSSNPCFADGNVLMSDRITQKNVREIRKGDQIFCPETHSSATVQCVVKTICEEGKVFLVNVGGLLVTPWHPIKLNDAWVFPDDVAPKSQQKCDAVYSFVVDNGHVMSINGISCVTFGHNLKTSDVVEHEYFGSSRVLNDLRTMPGWKEGLIELFPGCVTRHAVTGRINGLVYRKNVDDNKRLRVERNVNEAFVEHVC